MFVNKSSKNIYGALIPRLEPTIYRTQGEHANHYTTEIRLSSFLRCLPLKEKLIRAPYIFFELLFTNIYDLNTNLNSRTIMQLQNKALEMATIVIH
jgi:hypothetical protein